MTTVCSVDVPASLKTALNQEATRQRRSLSSIVTEALARYLEEPIHTLFQVSTSRRARRRRLRARGDGSKDTRTRRLRTWHFRQSGRRDGRPGWPRLSGAGPGPCFRGVSRRWRAFRGRHAVPTPAPTYRSTRSTALRTSKPAVMCFGVRAISFTRFGSKVVFKAYAPAPSSRRSRAGELDAASAQSEFNFTDLDGTLVGLWSPGFSSAFSVAGYHFHFLSADRQHGGHLLDLSAKTLRLRVEALTEFHLALPELGSLPQGGPQQRYGRAIGLRRKSPLDQSPSDTLTLRLARRAFVRRAEHRIPLSLHGLDLLKRELEFIKFASNLCLQMLGQRTTISGPEFLKPRPSFARNKDL